jgi:hypothetical protein
MIVRFSDVSEFIEELRENRKDNSIYAGIIRVTRKFNPWPDTSTIFNIYVVATYKMDDVIVRLDVYCGDTFLDEHTKKADQEGEKIIAKLKKVSTELGLRYRAGMYQLTDK